MGIKNGFFSDILQKMMRRDNLLILILSGILIFIVAMPTGQQKQKQMETTEALMQESMQRDYASDMEKRLKKILERMDGVGTCEVMITLKASEELIVEKDIVQNHTDTKEQDLNGGSRSILQSQSSPSTIFESKSGENIPYVVMTIPPKAEGVVVAAQGAENGKVRKNISDMIQVLFHIDAHRIKVGKMETSG
ncbi:MAG: hypothetical protein K6G30_06120 [Acetatifactor sp.]|nr:hypothetical protein [Acetatifactor sp.]